MGRNGDHATNEAKVSNSEWERESRDSEQEILTFAKKSRPMFRESEREREREREAVWRAFCHFYAVK